MREVKSSGIAPRNSTSTCCRWEGPRNSTRRLMQRARKGEGLLAPPRLWARGGPPPAEVFRNYQLEFQRLNLVTLFEKGPNVSGWFGPTLGRAADEDGLGQILSYNEAQERVLSGELKDPQPVWYFGFVTAYTDGIRPERMGA